MSDLALAAALAGAILLASTISVELGLSVALIELVAGVDRRQRDPRRRPELAELHRLVRRHRPDVPGGRRGRRAPAAARMEGVDLDRPRLVLRPVRRRRARRVLRPRLERTGRRRSAGSRCRRRASRSSTPCSSRPASTASSSASGSCRRRSSPTSRPSPGLTVLFLKPTLWIVPFVVVSVALIFGLPRASRLFFPRYGNRVIEPEIKLVFACLFLLMWLGSRANSQAALPVFVLGLAMSRFYASHRKEQDRLRVVSFAFLTPFFFLKGGMNVSTSALWANLGILGILFAAKMGPKLAGVYPLARRFTRAARGVHDAAHVHGPDVRDDHVALRAERAHHRPHAVLAADRGRRPLGDRPDGDRAALLPAEGGRAPRPDRAGRAGAAD